MIMRITEYTGATVLAVDYQKPPDCTWPKPVEDCLDVYKWALDEGYDPAKIFFAGDSAGGGLVVSVMALAREKGYPMPAGGIMISPWLDLTDSFSGSWSSNQEWDFLPRDFGAWFARMYAGDKNTLEDVSPCTQSTEGFPPLLVEVGNAECLYDQIVKWKNRARDEGIRVRFYEHEGMVHVFPLLFAAFSEPTIDLDEGVRQCCMSWKGKNDSGRPEHAYDHIAQFVQTVLTSTESDKNSYFTNTDDECVQI